MPPVLYLQADNCFRENKNKFVLSFLELLVRRGIFYEVHIYLIHTILLILFSYICKVIHKLENRTDIEKKTISIKGACQHHQLISQYDTHHNTLMRYIMHNDIQLVVNNKKTDIYDAYLYKKWYCIKKMCRLTKSINKLYRDRKFNWLEENLQNFLISSCYPYHVIF